MSTREVLTKFRKEVLYTYPKSNGKALIFHPNRESALKMSNNMYNIDNLDNELSYLDFGECGNSLKTLNGLNEDEDLIII